MLRLPLMLKLSKHFKPNSLMLHPSPPGREEDVQVYTLFSNSPFFTFLGGGGQVEGGVSRYGSSGSPPVHIS